MKAQSISGWLEGGGLTWLASEAPKHQRIVELGTWLGRSAACLAEHTQGTIYCVDHFNGNAHGQHTVFQRCIDDRAGVIAETKTNLREWLDSGRIVLLEMSGQEALPLLPEMMGGPADMVFIDGSHDYPDVVRDITTFRTLLRPGGILSGHDVGWPGVDKAVAELCPGWQRAPRCCIWWVQV